MYDKRDALRIQIGPVALPLEILPTPGQVLEFFIEDIKHGMRLNEDYLRRTGYRLPTEAEWEYACRAGASASHSFGESIELLPHYAWYSGNSQNQVHASGQLKPNRFGLFDMHGNVWEWCQESLRPYVSSGDQASEDVPDLSSLDDAGNRTLRGGAFDYHEASIRAAHRKEYPPDLRNNSVGFRIVRSIRPQD